MELLFRRIECGRELWAERERERGLVISKQIRNFEAISRLLEVFEFYEKFFEK